MDLQFPDLIDLLANDLCLDNNIDIEYDNINLGKIKYNDVSLSHDQEDIVFVEIYKELSYDKIESWATNVLKTTIENIQQELPKIVFQHRDILLKSVFDKNKQANGKLNNLSEEFKDIEEDCYLAKNQRFIIQINLTTTKK